jgi:MFS family permease
MDYPTIEEEAFEEGETRERTYTGVLPSDAAVATGDAKLRTIFKIPVKEGVTYANILAIPLVPCGVMIISSYLNAQVIFLLASPDFFDVPTDKIGFVSASLVFWSLPGAILGTFMCGFIFDILGRRLTLFMSFFLAGGLMCIVPWTKPNVYPWLMIVRIMI